MYTAHPASFFNTFHKKKRMSSLHFGMFLFAFAYFLWFMPLAYLSPGFSVMGMAADTVGNGFSQVADTVNGQVADYFSSQVAVLQKTGEVLAYTGNSIGDAARNFVVQPHTQFAIAPVVHQLLTDAGR